MYLKTKMDNLGYDLLFKIVIIGDSGVGKSSIINQYVNNFFSESYISTIGVDFMIKDIPITEVFNTIDLKNKKIRLQIWDTAGQERFRTITTSYYRNVDGIILVYDITNISSFNDIKGWIDDIYKYLNPQLHL